MYCAMGSVRGLIFGIFIPLELYEKSLMVKETPRKGKLLCCTLLKKNSTMNQFYVHCFFLLLQLCTTVEPLNNGHHWEPKFCPLWRGVPSSGISSIFPVGVVCPIGLCFQSLPLLNFGREA